MWCALVGWLLTGWVTLLGPPQPRDGLEAGAVVPHFTFKDTRWLERDLDDLGEARAIVVTFVSLDCPLARRVLPRVAQLEGTLRARGVRFVALFVGPSDDLVEVAARAVEQGLEFPVGRDFSGEAARAFGPERTPEFFVLDAQRVVRYRGRFDGRERIGGSGPDAARADLSEALEDVLAQRSVRVPRTIVDGCRVTAPLDPAQGAGRVPTWSEHIAPIVARACSSCHARAGAAPFPLTTLAEVSAHAAMVDEVVAERRMPPWHASRLYGEFENDPSLSREEIALVRRWIAHGTPAGAASLVETRPARAAHAEPSADGWRIGLPDLVIRAAVSEVVPAQGRVPYRYVVLPRIFLRDTWIEAVEIRPSAPSVVHHANLGSYELGANVKAAKFITGHVPGGVPLALDPGSAVLVPAGSVLGLQVHYVPTGTETTDRLSVGLRFPRVPVQRRLRMLDLSNQRFEIPPFAPAHEVRAKRMFDVDAVGLGLFVHMHLRGRDMSFESRPPGAPAEPLLLVPNFDFNWQLGYRWPRDAVHFAKGTEIGCRAHFDNSRFNPWNPAPERAIKFGLETEDEMMYGFLFYFAEKEQLGLEIDPSDGSAVALGTTKAEKAR